MRTLIAFVLLCGVCSAQEKFSLCANGKCMVQKVLPPYNRPTQTTVTQATSTVTNATVTTTPVVTRRYFFRHK